jgi:hypothetical protein
MYYDAYFGIYPRSELQPISSTHITVPLGQLAIASAVKDRCPEAEVRVFYGEMTDEQVIRSEIERLAAGESRVLIGISLNAGSSGRALEMVRYFDGIGMDVVLGGPEVTLYEAEERELMLEDRPYIRAIVIGTGEHVIPDIIEKGWRKELPNVIFRTVPRGELFLGPIRADCHLDFATISIDYGLLYGIEHSHGVSYLWRTDCHLAGEDRCYFCGRLRLGLGERPAERVWEELRQVRDQWGIQEYYNVADSVAVSVESLERFVQSQPADFGTERHRCFINSHQVNARTIRCLQQLNALAAVGIESYDLFHKVGKHPASIEDNENALAQLDKARIDTAVSFVLGLPGETAETLESTGDYILNLVNNHECVKGVELSPLTVTAGSRAYRDMLRKTARHDFGQPPFNTVDLSEEYFRVMCKITREDALRSIFSTASILVRSREDFRVDVKGIMPVEYSRNCLILAPGSDRFRCSPTRGISGT